MKKYIASIGYIIKFKVEAENEKEAKEKAWEQFTSGDVPEPEVEVKEIKEIKEKRE